MIEQYNKTHYVSDMIIWSFESILSGDKLSNY